MLYLEYLIHFRSAWNSGFRKDLESFKFLYLLTSLRFENLFIVLLLIGMFFQSFFNSFNDYLVSVIIGLRNLSRIKAENRYLDINLTYNL